MHVSLLFASGAPSMVHGLQWPGTWQPGLQSHVYHVYLHDLGQVSWYHCPSSSPFTKWRSRVTKCFSGFGCEKRVDLSGVGGRGMYYRDRRGRVNLD